MDCSQLRVPLVCRQQPEYPRQWTDLSQWYPLSWTALSQVPWITKMSVVIQCWTDLSQQMSASAERYGRTVPIWALQERVCQPQAVKLLPVCEMHTGKRAFISFNLVVCFIFASCLISTSWYATKMWQPYKITCILYI